MTNDNLDSTPPATEQPSQKTDEEIGDSFYDPNLTYGWALRGDFGADFNHMRDVVGFTEDEARQEIVEASQFFSDARIPVRQASALHGLFVRNIGKPADDETVRGWTAEARQHLRETYGSDADSRLAAVNEFVGRYPGLNKHLKESGLGSHPRVVAALAEQARNFRRR